MSDNWALGLLANGKIPSLWDVSISDMLFHFRNQPFVPHVPLDLPALARMFHVTLSGADLLRICPAP
eukprot:6260135-Prorocentrum_lima.AAC.1